MPSDAGARRTKALFVGRDHEMAALREALDAARSGRGGLVMISGEAGIGKSRLAEVFAEEARASDTRVAWGRCWEAGGAPAFWPWVQVLRSLVRGLDRQALESAFEGTGDEVARILPDLRDIFAAPKGPTADEETEAARFGLFDAVSRSIRRLAGDRPLIVILDDLHAADETSLLLLRFVRTDLADTSLLLLGTYREGELDAADPRLIDQRHT
jgi:predicted ATPase